MLINAIAFDTNMLIGLAIDALLVAILLLFAVVGAKKGIIKMAFGLVTVVAVFALSLWLVSPISNLLIKNTNLDEKLMQSLEEPISSKLPGSYTTLYYFDLDSNSETPDELVCDKDGTPMPYDRIFEGTVLDTFGLSKLIKPMIERSLEDTDHVYLVSAITFSIASIIILTVTLIVLLILIRIIFAILTKLLSKAVASLYIAHFFDRFVGMIFGLALGAVVGLVLVTIVQLMQNMSFMEPVMTAVQRSYITKFVMDNNFAYTFIVQKVNLQSILTKLFPGSGS